MVLLCTPCWAPERAAPAMRSCLRTIVGNYSIAFSRSVLAEGSSANHRRVLSRISLSALASWPRLAARNAPLNSGDAMLQSGDSVPARAHHRRVHRDDGAINAASFSNKFVASLRDVESIQREPGHASLPLICASVSSCRMVTRMILVPARLSRRLWAKPRGATGRRSIAGRTGRTNEAQAPGRGAQRPTHKIKT